jgi:hypothetical protein
VYVFVVDPFEKQKRDARRALAEAIFDGYLKPPTHCPGCGEHTIVTGHHFDYARPLDVHWLCYWCHFCEHQKQLGLPVPSQRRSPVPAYRAPRTRQPSKRPVGRPRDVDRYTRPRPDPTPRTYGEYVGHPVVRRNGRPALRDPQHPLARSGFVYVEDLLVLEQLGRPRQLGDSVTYRDGNRWNWNPVNAEVHARLLDPHIYVGGNVSGTIFNLTCDRVTFSMHDLDASAHATVNAMLGLDSRVGYIGYNGNQHHTLDDGYHLSQQLRAQGFDVRIDPIVQQYWQRAPKAR